MDLMFSVFRTQHYYLCKSNEMNLKLHVYSVHYMILSPTCFGPSEPSLGRNKYQREHS